MNTFETKKKQKASEKLESLSKDTRCKEESNGNFRAKKYI